MKPDLLLVADGSAARWPGPRFPGRALRSSDEIRAAFGQPRARRPMVWVARDAGLFRTALEDPPVLRTEHRLLLLEAAEPDERELLGVFFRFVVSPADGMRLLPPDELREVLASPAPGDLFVGGVVSGPLVVLFRGTLSPVVLPLAWFERREGAARPDFASFEVTDFGQTVRFGEYEAAADLILYAHDPEYRRRARDREIRHDPSFGASVRRLRLLQGVRRGDFPGISEKEVARIERGEVERPHARTLEVIAARLGVPVSELGSY